MTPGKRQAHQSACAWLTRPWPSRRTVPTPMFFWPKRRRNSKQAAALYAQGVAAGERGLGEKDFAEGVGHFWGIVKTRPYMRARLGLAESLWQIGQRAEAINHLWEMLRLNPGDNQGVRYLLLAWLLADGDNAQAKKLMEGYPGDGAASWLYGRCLLAFRTEGNSEHARQSLSVAIAANRHVPAYLLRRKRMPTYLPDTYTLGSENEAVICVDEQAEAWNSSPAALRWLEGSR